MNVAALSMVMMLHLAAVGATFRLKGHPRLDQDCSEALQHVLDHVIGPYAKHRLPYLGRQMPITQVPCEAHELTWILMPDFNDAFRSGLNLQPLPILKQQAVSISHRDSFPKVEKDVFTLIRTQANASTMARVKIDSEGARGLFLRPMPGGAMNGNAMHRHIST
jgi:hypothetical protein